MRKVKTRPKSTNVNLKSNRGRSKKKSKEKRGKVGIEKQSSGQRLVRTDL